MPPLPSSETIETPVEADVVWEALSAECARLIEMAPNTIFKPLAVFTTPPTLDPPSSSPAPPLTSFSSALPGLYKASVALRRTLETIQYSVQQSAAAVLHGHPIPTTFWTNLGGLSRIILTAEVLLKSSDAIQAGCAAWTSSVSSSSSELSAEEIQEANSSEAFISHMLGTSPWKALNALQFEVPDAAPVAGNANLGSAVSAALRTLVANPPSHPNDGAPILPFLLPLISALYPEPGPSTAGAIPTPSVHLAALKFLPASKTVVTPSSLTSVVTNADKTLPSLLAKLALAPYPAVEEVDAAVELAQSISSAWHMALAPGKPLPASVAEWSALRLALVMPVALMDAISDPPPALVLAADGTDLKWTSQAVMDGVFANAYTMGGGGDLDALVRVWSAALGSKERTVKLVERLLVPRLMRDVEGELSEHIASGRSGSVGRRAASLMHWSPTLASSVAASWSPSSPLAATLAAVKYLLTPDVPPPVASSSFATVTLSSIAEDPLGWVSHWAYSLNAQAFMDVSSNAGPSDRVPTLTVATVVSATALAGLSVLHSTLEAVTKALTPALKDVSAALRACPTPSGPSSIREAAKLGGDHPSEVAELHRSFVTVGRLLGVVRTLRTAAQRRAGADASAIPDTILQDLVKVGESEELPGVALLLPAVTLVGIASALKSRAAWTKTSKDVAEGKDGAALAGSWMGDGLAVGVAYVLAASGTAGQFDSFGWLETLRGHYASLASSGAKNKLKGSDSGSSKQATAAAVVRERREAELLVYSITTARNFFSQ